MPDGYQTLSPMVSEALAGLRQPQKSLPAKLFYDEEGCRLFGEITRLPEYYPTRTELALLRSVAPDLPRIGGGTLVEYGASDEAKACLLLPHLDAAAYVPVDVAASALSALSQRMARSHPQLRVLPLEADFLAPLALPAGVPGGPRLGFFPGSTVGNLEPAAARLFLEQVAATLGRPASFLVGVDLRKSPAVLVPAYDDSRGVTAAFNRNILVHLNREAAATFDTGQFRHRAVWNDAESRIEMHLESLQPQTATIGDAVIHFAAGETIHTENSYKHTVAGFQALAASAGWTPRRVWTDPQALFSIHLIATA